MEKKSYRPLFQQKMTEVHTNEEIKLAFESSFSACFGLKEDREIGARMQLFGKIWEINPDAIIAEVDLFVAHVDPVSMRGQYLVISKNGTRESNDLLGQWLEGSGVITSPWYIQSKKKAGIKTCYHYIPKSDKPAVVMKANLLIDGGDLLLSVRHFSSADHARMKSDK